MSDTISTATKTQEEDFDKLFNDRVGLNGPEAEKAAEVDNLLNRIGVNREDVEDKGPEPVSETLKAAIDRNPALAAELDITSASDNEKTDPIDDFLSKIDQEPAPSAAQLADHVVEVVSHVVEQNTAGAAVNVADKLVPELGTVMQHRGPSAIAYGFPPAVDALITKAKLSPEQTTHLLSQFSNLFTLSSQMRARVETIDIRGPEDETAIAEAKECHKILRDERLNAEKRKKIVKEPYLRPSQLIDGVFRIWMDEIGPLEKTAKEKAEYVENLERERIAKLKDERCEKLRIFEADISAFPNLGEMTEVAFEAIYTGVRETYHTKKRIEQQAEQDRLERERLNEIERQRLADENKRLAKEKDAADAREAEQRQIAADAEAKRKAAQDQLDRQAAERRTEEARIAAEAETKRLAPDKEKIEMWQMEIYAAVQKIPELESPKAKMLVSDHRDQFIELLKRLTAERASL